MHPTRAAALRFFNKVGEVAEAEGHHPDLHLTNYRWV
jgi:4a-hydroxytetrahydrobiopterin dehydratase